MSFLVNARRDHRAGYVFHAVLAGIAALEHFSAFSVVINLVGMTLHLYLAIAEEGKTP